MNYYNEINIFSLFERDLNWVEKRYCMSHPNQPISDILGNLILCNYNRHEDLISKILNKKWLFRQ